MTRDIKDISSDELQAWMDKGGCLQLCGECTLHKECEPYDLRSWSFTEILRLREHLKTETATTTMLREELAAKGPSVEWTPIGTTPWGDTAPWDREVLLTGESGYCTPHDKFVINGYRKRDWHHGQWNDATGTLLSDAGWEPRLWAELPRLPEGKPDEAARIASLPEAERVEEIRKLLEVKNVVQ